MWDGYPIFYDDYYSIIPDQKHPHVPQVYIPNICHKKKFIFLKKLRGKKHTKKPIFFWS